MTPSGSTPAGPPRRGSAGAARAAAAALAERDPVLARLVAHFGPPVLPKPQDGHFAALVRSITYQQLATGAATSIHTRLVVALDGDVSPQRLLATPTEVLRAAGLSGNKVRSLQDLAEKVADATVTLDPRRLARQSDEEIEAHLITVRGIGKWSADMFLLFQLRRPDVWPTGDLAVRRGYALAWGTATPSPKELDAIGEPYRPYRSTVAWYCWQAAGPLGITPSTP